MSELKAYKGDVTIPVYGTIADAEVYLKEDVDAAIEELKTALNESEEARYEAGADAADYYQENRMLKRALGLMRAYFCGRSSEYFSGMASRCKIGQEDFYKEVSEKARRYLKASYKCQAMLQKLR